MELIINNFNLNDTITSGQCFRWTKNEDNSFDVILKDRVINIKQIINKLIVNSNKNENLKEIITEYFDLNRNYEEIHKILIQKDKTMKEIIESCKGYRIMNQDSFEMCISYIISQNNNVKRISNSLEKISKKYGQKIVFNNKEYYLFPTYEEIKNITEEELREFGVGFRDKYIINFLNKIKENDKFVENLKLMDTTKALKELMEIKGIGLKVASCILLFGFKRLDAFPIDTWTRHTITNKYNIKNDVKTIQEFAKENYSSYTSLAIQYMFHYGKNVK